MLIRIPVYSGWFNTIRRLPHGNVTSWITSGRGLGNILIVQDPLNSNINGILPYKIQQKQRNAQISYCKDFQQAARLEYQRAYQRGQHENGKHRRQQIANFKHDSFYVYYFRCEPFSNHPIILFLSVGLLHFPAFNFSIIKNVR